VAAAFANAGTQSFGNNVNTLMKVAVGQKAKQIRITFTPAEPTAVVYLAEIEVNGAPQTRSRAIAALASGRTGARTPGRWRG